MQQRGRRHQRAVRVLTGSGTHAVVVEDNTAADGVKRKLYLDGRLVGGSTVMNTHRTGGANRFRIGAQPDGTQPFTGQIDRVFVTGYAMTRTRSLRIYAKATQPMASSPKNAGDHVEGFDSGSVLVVADTLDAQHYIDLTLAEGDAMRQRTRDQGRSGARARSAAGKCRSRAKGGFVRGQGRGRQLHDHLRRAPT
jgi:hypothetical protein